MTSSFWHNAHKNMVALLTSLTRHKLPILNVTKSLVLTSQGLKNMFGSVILKQGWPIVFYEHQLPFSFDSGPSGSEESVIGNRRLSAFDYLCVNKEHG